MKGIAITCLVTLLSATLSQAKVVVSEDFQKFTSGTDTSADMSAEVTDFNTLTQTEGWTGATVYQAGGSAYLAIGTGLLTTPAVDLSANSGNYSVSFRAKSETPGAMLFIMDSNAGYNISMLTPEWQSFTVTLNTGSGISAGMSNTQVSFSAMYAEIYIDDIVVDDSGLGIPIPLPAAEFCRESFKARWEAGLNAQSYLLNVFTLDYNKTTTIFERRYLLQDKEVSGTEYTVTEAEFDLPLYYTVCSKAGDVVSGESAIMTVYPQTVSAPTANAPTEITSNGFTANWQESDIATCYYLHVLKHHVAATDETYTVIDTDFSDIHSEGTIDTPQKELEWTFDGDWFANMPVMAEGIIGLNNQDINFFGQAYLQSPAIDLSNSDGKVTVSFKAFGRKGLTDATVRLANNNGTGINFVDTQNFTVTETQDEYSFTLENGNATSKIVITSTQDGGMLFIDDLKVTIELPAEKSIILPIRTYNVEGTSAAVDNLGIQADDRVAYYVVGSWAVKHEEGVVRQIPEVLSDASNHVWVTLYSGVENINTDVKAEISVSGSILTINNAQGQPVGIFGVDGRAVYSATASDSVSLQLSAGIYIVSVGNRSVKVAVGN